MKFLAVTLLLALCGCATTTAPQKADGANASPPMPGTETINGEDMKNNGRTNNADALRAESPIFH